MKFKDMRQKTEAELRELVNFSRKARLCAVLGLRGASDSDAAKLSSSVRVHRKDVARALAAISMLKKTSSNAPKNGVSGKAGKIVDKKSKR